MLSRFIAFILVIQCSQVASVDRSKFRTCDNTAFCRRNRSPETPPPLYHVVKDSVVSNAQEGLSALLKGNEPEAPQYNLNIKFYDSGVSRIQIREANPLKPRWEASDIVLEDQLTLSNHKVVNQDNVLSIEYLAGHVLELTMSPFQATLSVEGKPMIVVNGQNMFHFEHQRSRDGEVAAPTAGISPPSDEDKHGGKKIVGYWEDGLAIYEDGSREEKTVVEVEVDVSAEDAAVGATTSTSRFSVEGDGYWEESFGGHRDSKPYGPMSVGMDITFPQSMHLYGLPEHASSLKLQTTRGANAHYSEPYRMYTLDVFEYELDEPMALYGGIPMIMAHSVVGTAGVFWFNPSETFIDISEDSEKKSSTSHWISESGIVDLFLMPGRSPKKVLSQFTQLVGTQDLPPMFSLGYHQCRWNYKDTKDVLQVHGKFEELNIPYDVLWLDIEHTDGKRYFTWDYNLFPDPVTMQDALWKEGRRMVTIVDPHLKRDNNYYIHTEATAKSLYIKKSDGKEDYDGWCWPGSSSYLDFTQEHVRQWWAEQFSIDKYKESTMSLFTWNDMNEPSVFNGPEVSMPKDTKNLQGVEHREWHNLYGMYQQRATAEGHILRSGGKERPFVLSRSFYAGSQRFGAIWTGDNKAEWSHLQIASPMLLSIGLGGLTFAGADVGGFFGNTESELMVRWIQAGSYTPFFRGHAHHDAKRREPWMFGEPSTTQIRQAIMSRYALLPYWYTLFYEASKTGNPTMRPLFFEYPKDEATFNMDDEWLVGSDILVKPVTSGKGVTSTSVYLPGSEPWFDVETYDKYFGPKHVSVSTPLDKIAAFQRGGSIVPRKLRLRRSTKLMTKDPYTLFVALSNSGSASGDLYMDDEVTFNYREGSYSLRRFDFNQNVLSSSAIVSSNFEVQSTIERIVVMGLKAPPTKITLKLQNQQNKNLEFSYENSVLTIRKPDMNVNTDFEIMFE
jgi:alpha 1,3-glucosidase